MSHQFLVIIRPLTEIDSNYYKLGDLIGIPHTRE